MIIYDGDEFTTNVNGEELTLTIERDYDAQNPREFDHITHLLCWWHGRHNLGDTNVYNDPVEVLTELLVASGKSEYAIESMFEPRENETTKDVHARIMKSLEEYCIIKFCYLFDHSGITMSLHDFGDPWDSGIAGVIYVTKDEMLNYTDATEETWKDKANSLIEHDIDLYDTWLRGDIYEFIITKEIKCEKCGHTTQEFVDSCCGFYGDDIEKNGMLDCLPDEFVKLLKKEK